MIDYEATASKGKKEFKERALARKRLDEIIIVVVFETCFL